MNTEKPLRILILMSYFNRPILVKRALESILQAGKLHNHWELAFGDDGSEIPGRPIVEDVLHKHLDRVYFVRNEMSFDEKIKQGLILGKLANEAIVESKADIAIILCDDDELVPTYLRDLSVYFNKNPNILYCYSKVYLFNPLIQEVRSRNAGGKFNIWKEPIDPVGKVDASQVAWRLKCCKELGAWFAPTTKRVPGKPWVQDTDKSFFQNLYDKCGLCYPTGFFGQYKGIHDYQLLWHKNVSAASLWAYDQMCKKLGGEAF